MTYLQVYIYLTNQGICAFLIGSTFLMHLEYIQGYTYLFSKNFSLINGSLLSVSIHTSRINVISKSSRIQPHITLRFT